MIELNSIQLLVIFVHFCLRSVVGSPSNFQLDYPQSDEPELIFANVIYRHGERNIGRGYLNDPWGSESYWPGGYGQLTNTGKQQQYELGKYFRQRFKTLLDKSKGMNINHIVYVQSTNYDRTLMSAASNLAGLFPPEGDEVWNSNLTWQPIPIHTIPREFDHILSFSRTCARYKNEYTKYKDNSDHRLLYKKFKPLLRYLELHSGNEIRDFFDVWDLFGCLQIEESRNFELPDWTKNVFVPGGDMKFVTTYAIMHGSETPEMARLKMGFMLREILDRFRMKIKSKLSPDRSIWMYSAHDSTIAVFLNALELFEPHVPPFCATIFVELYKLKSDFYVQVSYKNSTGDPVPFHIPYCGPMCQIDMFCGIFEAVVPTADFEEECRVKEMPEPIETPLISETESPEDKSKMLLTALSVGLTISILLLAAASWKLQFQEKSDASEIQGSSIVVNTIK